MMMRCQSTLAASGAVICLLLAACGMGSLRGSDDSPMYSEARHKGGSNSGGQYAPPGAPSNGSANEDASEAPVAPPPGESESTWIQLSTDDSTSMASAQLYKAGLSWLGLLPHEFVNYYDPPTELFEQEPWAVYHEVDAHTEFGMSGDRFDVERAGDCPTDLTANSETEPDCTSTETLDMVELLFQLRADRVAHETRRNWNLFYCVDVSGSMGGDKIAFVRDALMKSLSHLKEGDRATLVTFESSSHDIFIDQEISVHRAEIQQAFAGLESGGSTNMIAGLHRTYELAQQNFNPNMLQRVILFSDGNANVGDTDIQTFSSLTRINNQEGIYLSGVGVGTDYDWHRMNDLTDAGKGAHVFLPDANEVNLIFGDYFPKLIEVAADSIAIEMTLPAGIRLDSFSGEEVSTNPEERLQNIILAAGDDMTFLARLVVEDAAALAEPATLKVTLRPLATSSDVVVEIPIARFDDLLADPGSLFERTRLVDEFAHLATGGGNPDPALLSALDAMGSLDWGLNEIQGLLQSM